MAKYRILDLFCGAGGFSYGMDKNPNFETLIALDNDKYAGESILIHGKILQKIWVTARRHNVRKRFI